MRLIFMMDFNRGGDYKQLFELAVETFGTEPNDQPDTDDNGSSEGFGENAQEQLCADKFTRELFFGAMEHLEEIDAMIKANTVGWKPERLSKVMLALIRLAIFEIKFYGDTPASIAVNEAVELSKRYDDSGAHAFLNGVLGAIARM